MTLLRDWKDELEEGLLTTEKPALQQYQLIWCFQGCLNTLPIKQCLNEIQLIRICRNQKIRKNSMINIELRKQICSRITSMNKGVLLSFPLCDLWSLSSYTGIQGAYEA